MAEAVAPTPLQASGGIRSLADAEALLDAGAERVVIGTAAFPDPAPLGTGARRAARGRPRCQGRPRPQRRLDRRLRPRAAPARSSCASPPGSNASSAPRSIATGRSPDPTSSWSPAVAASGLRVLAAGGVRSPADVAALAEAGAEAAVVGRAILAAEAPGID